MTKKQFLILLFIFIPFFSKEKNTSLKTNVKYEIIDNTACEKYAKFFYKIEGGLAYFPMVYGGLTNRGITWQTYINYCNSKNKVINYKDFANLSEEQVKNIIYDFYWSKNNLDHLTNNLLKYHIVDFYCATGNAALYHINLTLSKIGINNGNSDYSFLTLETIKELKEKKLENIFLKELIKTRYAYYDNTIFERTLKIRVYTLNLYDKKSIDIDTFDYYHYHKNYENTVKYFYDLYHS